MKNRRFGYIPDLPDFRDKAFALAAPIALPQVVDLRSKMPPVYDQGDLGSCSGNAIAAAFDFERNRQGKPFLSPSRLFIYFCEREMEGTIASDSGAMVRDGLKAVARMGVCSELVWPYNTWRFADRPDAPSYAEALLNQVLSYRRLSADLRSMQSCLASGLPFVFGFSVYESFMSDAVMASGVVPMPDYSEQQVGGHAVLAVGYDMARRAFLVRNSWGTGWGLVGYCWMPFDYLSSPDLADDRWSIRLVEQ